MKAKDYIRTVIEATLEEVRAEFGNQIPVKVKAKILSDAVNDAVIVQLREKTKKIIEAAKLLDTV